MFIKKAERHLKWLVADKYVIIWTKKHGSYLNIGNLSSSCINM